MRLLEFSAAKIAALLLALVAFVTALGWFLASRFAPPPPKVVVMSTGAEDGAYHAFANRYREHLAKHGITLELLPSAGAVENLERLKARERGVSIALVQAGIGTPNDAPGVMTLGSMFYEPLWVFARTSRPVEEFMLRGKRIAIGVPGSGTHAVALSHAKESGLDTPPTQLVAIGGTAAADALENGNVDVAFFVSAPEAPTIQRLLRAPGIQLLGTGRADAYSRRLPYLHKLVLPRGAMDIANDIPPVDTPMVAVTANLLAVDDLHPAISDLLLEAADVVHGPAGLFNEVDEFPQVRDRTFAVSPDAERFYKQGPPALRRYLPFWAAAWIERAIFFVIPMLALLIPILHYLPIAWRWRMRRNVYRYYAELKSIEGAARRGEGDARKQLGRLDAVEERLNRTWVPLGFASELYELRMHINFVRDVVRSRNARPVEAPAVAAVDVQERVAR
jgi:TRAP-type uncharacterized transport system substrate-binding protein